MGMFGSSKPKNTLGRRVQKAEARARKLEKKEDQHKRLRKAQATIQRLQGKV